MKIRHQHTINTTATQFYTNSITTIKQKYSGRQTDGWTDGQTDVSINKLQVNVDTWTNVWMVIFVVMQYVVAASCSS